MQREDRHIHGRTGMELRIRQRRVDGVQPDPGAGGLPTKAEPSSNANDGTSSQKLILLRRGKAMSGEPIMIGTNQLPKPPNVAGMTTKNTMIRPCAVAITLYI